MIENKECVPFVINIKINKHFPKYIELTKLFIINYTSFPTLTRFNKIMSSKNAKSQLNLATFIDKTMNVRKSIIDSQININYDIVILLTSHVNILFSLLFKSLVI